MLSYECYYNKKIGNYLKKKTKGSRARMTYYDHNIFKE